MKLVVLSGPTTEVKDVHSTQQLTGVRIKSVTITYEDVHPRDWNELAEWLKQVIFPRLVP